MNKEINNFIQQNKYTTPKNLSQLYSMTIFSVQQLLTERRNALLIERGKKGAQRIRENNIALVESQINNKQNYS